MSAYMIYVFVYVLSWDFCETFNIFIFLVATQWKENAHVSQDGQAYFVMRPVLMASMDMDAWSRVYVWMEECATVPLVGASVPLASQ